VTEEGYLPGVPVCLVSGTGSAVRVGQGVFSVFFIVLVLVLVQVVVRMSSTSATKTSIISCVIVLLLMC
jgi:hypothetical protein